MLAIIPSVTTAMRIKKLLRQKDITVEVMQTPKSLSNTGCSYCVRFDDRYLPEVLDAVKSIRSNIKSLWSDEGEPL
jgi:hypothetical protein